MSGYVPVIKKEFKPSASTWWNDFRRKRDPDEFRPNGAQIYYGYQGEGKTLSAIHHLIKLKRRYPKAIICTNLELTGYTALQARDEETVKSYIRRGIKADSYYIRFDTFNEFLAVLRYARNGKYGTILLADEIHNYLHSHDSKGVPLWVVQAISQQRKQYMVVIGTVQVYDDVVKPIRTQTDNMIKCRRIGYLIINKAYDPRDLENDYGELIGKPRKVGFYFITQKLRDSYDTRQVIDSGREIFSFDGGVSVKVESGSKVKRKR